MDAKLFNKISEGLARAAELRKQANATNDPAWKDELLELESRWLDIVESYRVVSDSDRFPERCLCATVCPEGRDKADWNFAAGRPV